MNISQSTLTEFEKERLLNKIIPPQGSNSFYKIGNGEINLYSIRDDINDYRFNLLTNSGSIHTGKSKFIISGDIIDCNNPYNTLTIISDTELVVDDSIHLSNGKSELHGTLNLSANSTIEIMKKGELILYSDSLLKISNGSKILIDNESLMKIYGKIQIHISAIDYLLNIPNIVIDSSAVMEVTGLEELGNRLYSLTDYYTFLSHRVINKYTQGEKNFDDGRIGFTWTGGDPKDNSQYLKISTMMGNSILGDFKFSVLGLPEEDIHNLQIISDLHIQKKSILYITEKYLDYKYIHPELYIGTLLGNSKRTGTCTVDGTIIADGDNVIINIDRKSKMTINGEVYIRNGATLLSTYNDDTTVLFINGLLTIDTIDQIKTFEHDQIEFGESGKLVILNPETEEKRLLWTTPNGIENTDLYRLFKDRIEHVEYHISKNNGIGIDKNFDFFSTQFKEWYGGRRIEQAIYEGLIVWHDGGFIELYSDIIPWVSSDCTLLHASRIFKSVGSYDNEKLQDVVNRLTYAGCGNILFRFIDGDTIGEVILTLEKIKMTNVVNYPLTDNYILDTSNTGQLFLRNKIGSATQKNIINNKSKIVSIDSTRTIFPLK